MASTAALILIWVCAGFTLASAVVSAVFTRLTWRHYREIERLDQEMRRIDQEMWELWHELGAALEREGLTR